MKRIHQRQEHTKSYYAASVTEITDYPVLEGAKTADVCIVGGGFTGVSTALTRPHEPAVCQAAVTSTAATATSTPLRNGV